MLCRVHVHVRIHASYVRTSGPWVSHVISFLYSADVLATLLVSIDLLSILFLVRWIVFLLKVLLINWKNEEAPGTWVCVYKLIQYVRVHNWICICSLGRTWKDFKIFSSMFGMWFCVVFFQEIAWQRLDELQPVSDDVISRGMNGLKLYMVAPFLA